MCQLRVIILCTGFPTRSEMAEAFLSKYAGDRFEPRGAGLEPKGLNPLRVSVRNEVGIGVSGQKSQGVDTYLGKLLF